MSEQAASPGAGPCPVPRAPGLESSKQPAPSACVAACWGGEAGPASEARRALAQGGPALSLLHLAPAPSSASNQLWHKGRKQPGKAAGEAARNCADEETGVPTPQGRDGVPGGPSGQRCCELLPARGKSGSALVAIEAESDCCWNLR